MTKLIRVDLDPQVHTTIGPIRIAIGPAMHRLTLGQARELLEQLGLALSASEPIPDTLRPEPVTKPDTPVPIKRASGEHRLELPHGVAAEVERILDEGKTKA